MVSTDRPYEEAHSELLELVLARLRGAGLLA